VGEGGTTTLKETEGDEVEEAREEAEEEEELEREEEGEEKEETSVISTVREGVVDVEDEEEEESIGGKPFLAAFLASSRIFSITATMFFPSYKSPDSNVTSVFMAKNLQAFK